jgi:hypothetical protein
MFAVAFWFFKNWHCILPEDGTHVPKHAGQAHLMIVLINDVHFADIKMLHADKKNARK